MIEWNMTLRDNTDGSASLVIFEDGVETEYRGYVLTEGVVGLDTYFWRGKNFGIYQTDHELLVEKFPNAEYLIEYMKADEWLGAKKGRAVKAPLAFMTNWFKRARGGNFSKGGVIY